MDSIICEHSTKHIKNSTPVQVVSFVMIRLKVLYENFLNHGTRLDKNTSNGAVKLSFYTKMLYFYHLRFIMMKIVKIDSFIDS